MLFAEAEYRTRCERAQNAMHRDGIDALLLTMHGNFDYFAGFDINQPWTSATLEKCDEIGLPVIRFGRVGHGMGLGMTEPPHVALFDPTVLRPGMVITVEPAVFDDSGIYCIEEMVAVTEDGHEVLSGAPRELATI